MSNAVLSAQDRDTTEKYAAMPFEADFVRRSAPKAVFLWDYFFEKACKACV